MDDTLSLHWLKTFTIICCLDFRNIVEWTQESKCIQMFLWVEQWKSISDCLIWAILDVFVLYTKLYQNCLSKFPFFFRNFNFLVVAKTEPMEWKHQPLSGHKRSILWTLHHNVFEIHCGTPPLNCSHCSGVFPPGNASSVISRPVYMIAVVRHKGGRVNGVSQDYLKVKWDK